MRRSLLIVAAVSLLAVVALGRCSPGPDRDSYIRANLRAMAQIPVYPRSTLAGTHTSACRERDGAYTKAVGYWTTVTYTLPPRAESREVIDFFKRELASWRLEQQSAAPSLSLRKGDDYVHILVAPGEYTVGIDHAHPGCPGA